MRKRKLRSKAPGKLILSGEYGVLKGIRGIAFAIKNYVEVDIELTAKGVVDIDLKDYGTTCSLDYGHIANVATLLAARYSDFLAGKAPIKTVIERPEELISYAIALMKLRNIGLTIAVKSTMPIASGMGSSAALIVSLVTGLAHICSLPYSLDTKFELARRLENLVHGHSSGIDLYAAMYGGCFSYAGGKSPAHPLRLPKMPLYAIWTGVPCVSTITCVEKTKDRLDDARMQDAFREVATAMHAAIAKSDVSQIIFCLRNNHRLLHSMGVVPAKVHRFVTAIEQAGFAAKVSGAGAIKGDNAGMLIAICDAQLIHSTCADFGYSYTSINLAPKGVRTYEYQC